MTTDAERRYLDRFRRVLDHVDAHLDGDLGMEALAEVAAFSPFHFHRQFAELTGITLHRYVQLARLKRASFALAFRDAPVTTVALDAGYGGSEAFARAFRQRLGQTPSEFRQTPDWEPWAAALAPHGHARSIPMTIAFTDSDVRIVDFPETRVALLAHRGSPATMGDTVRAFIAWRRATGLSPSRSRTFNLLHSDPETTPPGQFRMDVACEAATVAPNDAGVVADVIPAGRCAMVRMTGSGDSLKPAVHFLYAEWLPKSGEELRDLPIFAERVRFFPDVPENEAVTDIYLPLKD